MSSPRDHSADPLLQKPARSSPYIRQRQEELVLAREALLSETGAMNLAMASWRQVSATTRTETSTMPHRHHGEVLIEERRADIEARVLRAFVAYQVAKARTVGVRAYVEAIEADLRTRLGVAAP